MTVALLVMVAHGLDLVTFMAGISSFGVAIEAESNPLMRQVFAAGGLPLVAGLKTAGAVALACIAHMRRWALVPATGAGIAGAGINLMAISLVM